MREVFGVEVGKDLQIYDDMQSFRQREHMLLKVLHREQTCSVRASLF